eukprot:3318262-Pyramimonas_sp.AAC.1
MVILGDESRFRAIVSTAAVRSITGEESLRSFAVSRMGGSRGPDLRRCSTATPRRATSRSGSRISARSTTS